MQLVSPILVIDHAGTVNIISPPPSQNNGQKCQNISRLLRDKESLLNDVDLLLDLKKEHH